MTSKDSPGTQQLGTLRIHNTDAGTDHSQILYAVTNRTATNHELQIVPRCRKRTGRFARVLFPITRGGFEPGDASRFQGIRAQVRGAGKYAVIVITRTGNWTAPFEAFTDWNTDRDSIRVIDSRARHSKVDCQRPTTCRFRVSAGSRADRRFGIG